MKLITGAKSEAQRYYFFSERLANKIPDVPKDTPTIPIKKVGMIGAGTMGGGISMNFISRGHSCHHRGTQTRSPGPRIGSVRKNYMRGVKSGRTTEEKVDAMMSLFTPSLTWKTWSTAT